ncbi:hypothetical protein VHEMI03191 [[Torrubiella] hemipterigena]|uniref:Uncharacterized protein n=1 Tax=[Torrubiella] hemipterigena TaxID=1531966 RepID=A0A0A1TAI3_9HYPO|nr:hypothetical protein VHEMI03191 [[Torrubiella] hemipterigena]
MSTTEPSPIPTSSSSRPQSAPPPWSTLPSQPTGSSTSSVTYSIIATAAGLLNESFTAPLSCAGIRQLNSTVTTKPDGGLQSSWGWLYAAGCIPDMVDSSCLPYISGQRYGYETALDGKSADAHLPVFSPALGCPVGYSSACTMMTGVSWMLNAGQTAVGCCPSGYQCEPTGISCFSSATPGALVTNTACSNDGSSPLTASIGSSTIAIGCAPRVVYIRNVEADHGLSSGAKAAIGTCVGLAVITITLVGYILSRRRRRQRRKTTATTNEKSEHELEGSSELTVELQGDMKAFKAEADGKDNEMEIYELADTGVVEVPEDAFSPVELDNNNFHETQPTITIKDTAMADRLGTPDVILSPLSPHDEASALEPQATTKRFSFEKGH